MTKHLSAHFTLDELTISQTAARRGLDNTPPPEVFERLRFTAQQLEEVRTLLGSPIIVSSGYRCPALNAAVGGAKTSQHMRGEAVDFICPGYGPPVTVMSRLVDSGIEYDQLILEYTRWVHISFTHTPRHQALVIDSNGARSFA